MKRMALGLCAWLLLGGAALASDDARGRIQASMVVTGWVQVAPDGSVIRYTLDQRDKLPAPVVEVISKTVPEWKFHPILVDGKPIVADAKMSLRVVAVPLDNDQYRLRVDGATFGDKSSTGSVHYKVQKPPQYPRVALRARTGAIVYLALEVNRSGKVEQAIAQQVDLRARGSEVTMHLLRDAFATASVDAAKAWTFTIPETGSEAAQDHWTVRIPINFNIRDSNSARLRYGQWTSYVPGPVQSIPWEQDQIADGNNADAIPGDGVFTPDKRFALLTPLND